MTASLNTTYMQDYLDRQLQDAQALLELLGNEREALSGNDGEAIEAFAASKYRLAREVETATQQCNQLLEQSGFDTNKSGIEKFFQSCGEPHATAFSSRWKECQDILLQCQQENRVNGKLIDSSKRRIKQAISILQGQPVDEELYGKRGNTVNHATGSSLTRA